MAFAAIATMHRGLPRRGATPLFVGGFVVDCAGIVLLATLLARFSPQFSMIALQGVSIDYAGVDALFSQGRNARPGLRIEIDEWRVIAACNGGAVIGYRETQTDGTGQRTVRRSTVVFERDAHGRIVWRHLHETSVAG